MYANKVQILEKQEKYLVSQGKWPLSILSISPSIFVV